MTDDKSVQIAKLVKAAEEEWPHQLAIMALVCKTMRARYLEHKKNGFSDAEALDLCWRRGEM